MKTIQLTIRKTGGGEGDQNAEIEPKTTPLEIRLIDPVTEKEVIRFPVYAEDMFLESGNCNLRWKGLELKFDIAEYAVRQSSAEPVKNPEHLQPRAESNDRSQRNGAGRVTEEGEVPEGAPLRRITASRRHSPGEINNGKSLVFEIAEEESEAQHSHLSASEQVFLREQCRIEMEEQQRMIRELVLLEKNRYHSPLVHAAEAIADFAGDPKINSKSLNNRYLDCQKRLSEAARNYRISEEEREIYLQALKTLTKAYLIVLLNLPSSEWGYLTRYTVKGARNLFDQVNDQDFSQFFLNWWRAMGMETHLNERFFSAFLEGIGLSGPKAIV